MSIEEIINLNNITILIFALCATILFYIFETIDSFKEIYSNLSMENCKEKVIVKNLLSDLNKRTNIEFAIYNYRKGKCWYLIFFFCLSFLFLLVASYNFLNLLPPLIYILLILFISRVKWKTFDLLEFGLYLLNSYLKLILYIAISFFLVSTLLVFGSSYSSVNWAINTNWTINTTIFQSDNPLEIISGNKLSFSGILFTFGIGSSVIFSFVSSYNKRKEILSENSTSIKRKYQEWFKNNQNLDPKKYDEFDIAVNELKKDLTNFVNMNIYINIYESALLLSALFCVFGIYVLIGTDSVVELIFKRFTWFIILAIFYLFILFKHYNIPQETSAAIYENFFVCPYTHGFEDSVQSNCNEATSDDKQK